MQTILPGIPEFMLSIIENFLLIFMLITLIYRMLTIKATRQTLISQAKKFFGARLNTTYFLFYYQQLTY